MPPRYFTVRPSSAPKPAPGHPVSHALDLFVLEGGHQPAMEWVVGFDDLGQLAAQPVAAATGSVRGQISFHEVAGGSHRHLRAAELYLFEVQLMEQAAQIARASTIRCTFTARCWARCRPRGRGRSAKAR